MSWASEGVRRRHTGACDLPGPHAAKLHDRVVVKFLKFGVSKLIMLDASDDELTEPSHHDTRPNDSGVLHVVWHDGRACAGQLNGAALTRLTGIGERIIECVTGCSWLPWFLRRKAFGPPQDTVNAIRPPLARSGHLIISRTMRLPTRQSGMRAISDASQPEPLRHLSFRALLSNPRRSSTPSSISLSASSSRTNPSLAAPENPDTPRSSRGRRRVEI